MFNKSSSRVFTISDFIQWDNRGELILSPKYQRNSVWNDKAKAYLVDTIMKGLPIPPVFLRQTIDVNTKSAIKEIIDGQQRLRTILDFVVYETFPVRKVFDPVYGGLYFSQLPEEMQENILQYEVFSEIVSEKDDSLIYDMFARLNSNNVVLNKQELRNAKYWGDFKVFIYRKSSQYRDFFLDSNIFNDKDCARMKDVELMNSLVIYLTEGIVTETPVFVDKIYTKYDKVFASMDIVEGYIDKCMDVMGQLYSYLNGKYGIFSNKNYFYTLFCVIAHQLFELPEMSDFPRNPDYAVSEIDGHMNNLYMVLINFMNDVDIISNDKESDDYLKIQDFLKNHKSRTTNRNERISRIKVLNEYFI